VLLFEIAIQIARLNDKRRARSRADWDSWDPDAPSPIDTSPSPIEPPRPVDAPVPVEPSGVSRTSGHDDPTAVWDGWDPDRPERLDDVT